MRAHSQRRLIWILDVALGLALVGVLGWYVMRVRPALAQKDYVEPGYVAKSVETFKTPQPTARSARPPVSKEELAEIDKPQFKQGNTHFHWAYSGPTPPPPPEKAPTVQKRGPVEDDLAKLGEVRILMYVPPREGEQIAEGSIVFWEFKKSKKRKALRVGDFVTEKKGATTGIRLKNVVRKNAEKRVYEIIYEVIADPDAGPEKEGTYTYDGTLPLDPGLGVRWKDPAPAGAAAPGAVPPRGNEVVVVDPEGLARPRPDISSLKPDVTWEGRSAARVEFDQATWDYFRSGDADALAESVKTQEARDTSGNVIGLEITGISEGTPADAFKIKRGDILVSINDQPVRSRSDAVSVIQRIDPNATLVKVVVNRLGNHITFNVDPRDPKTRRTAATTLGRNLPEESR